MIVRQLYRPSFNVTGDSESGVTITFGGSFSPFGPTEVVLSPDEAHELATALDVTADEVVVEG